MSVYFVAQIKINDLERYDRYLEACDDVFLKYNGKYLAVDKSPEILEGEWQYSRSVIIEFPNESDLKEWYQSKEYQEILKYRLEGATCDTIIVHGIK